MSEGAQPGLAGIAAPRPLTDRLFFALRPDEAARRRIVLLAERLHADGRPSFRPIDPSRLHVTLVFFGDFAGLPQALVETACAAAASVPATRFELAFDRIGSFAAASRRRPLVLLGGEGLDALTAFRQRLSAALAAADAPHEAGRWTPHLTFAHGDRAAEAWPVEPIAWTASDFVLTASRIGRGRHDVLGRWPLRDPPPAGGAPLR